MNKKYLILGGVLIAVGGVGYFLYKRFVTDKVTKMATELEQQDAQAMAMAQAEAEAMVTNSTRPSTTLGSSSMTPIAYSPSGEPIYATIK
jgi:uncharacterized protein (UPF0333 family)